MEPQVAAVNLAKLVMGQHQHQVAAVNLAKLVMGQHLHQVAAVNLAKITNVQQYRAHVMIKRNTIVVDNL